MHDEKMLQRIVGAAVFFISFIVFFLTMAPTVSFWDCGEYIAATYTLGIPHPPGNPFYVVIGRVFTLLLFFIEEVAVRVNLISVISGALTALFLYLTSCRVVGGALKNSEIAGKKAIVYVSSFVGALMGVFNYTFWFSAVEASVYIPAVLTVVLNIYIIICWQQSKDQNRDKLLLLFTYIVYLGVGIHMMALFALLPGFVFVMLNDRDKLTDWRLWIVALLMGSVAYGVSLFLVIAPILFFVTLLFAYGSKTAGLIAGVVLPSVAIVRGFGAEEFSLSSTVPYLMVIGLALTGYFIDKGEWAISRNKWKLSFYIILFAVIGYSVHLFIPIRSAMEPMVDQNHPVIELSNGGRALRAHEQFKAALREEFPAQDLYIQYLAVLGRDPNTAQLLETFDRSVRFYGTHSASYNTFEDAVLSNSSLSAIHSDFIRSISLKPSLNNLYNSYRESLRDNSSLSVVRERQSAFIRALREEGNVDQRNAYVAYINAVRADDVASTAYNRYLRALQIEYPADAYASLMEKSSSEARALLSSFEKALSANEDISLSWSAYKRSVKENSADANSYRQIFNKALEQNVGSALSAYRSLEEAIANDSSVASAYQSVWDAKMLDRRGGRAYEDFLADVKSSPDVLVAFESFMDALSKNPQLENRYNRYIHSLNSFVLDELHWDAFKGFLERRQYGTESMTTRMFTRRGDFTTQFGIDGHMGLGGFHLTQFFHFGESINTDRRGTPEDESFHRGAIEANNIISGPIYRRFLILFIYLIPTFFVFWGISYWAKWDSKIMILFLLMWGSTSIGFALYMNFADGTRPDSIRDIRRHQEAMEHYNHRLQEWSQLNMQYETLRQQYAARGEVIPPMPPRPEEPRLRTVHREVRIRDYFYTVSFTFFGFWIGLSVAALLHLLYSGKKGALGIKSAPLVAALFSFLPIIPITQNWSQNDRSDDWIAFDYARNLLESCAPNAILFTNGDNDTFPLWFIQEAAGVRTDVRVVNFSLLNTDWYIRQLKRLEPRVPIPYNDYQIENELHPRMNEYGFRQDEPEPKVLPLTGLEVVPPTYREEPFLTTANILVLDIVDHNQWRKPIYFTVNTPRSSLMGLEPYLQTRGMVQRLLSPDEMGIQDTMPEHLIPFFERYDLEKTRYLIDSVYQFRGYFGEDAIILDDTSERTGRSYAFMIMRFVDEKVGFSKVEQLKQLVRRENGAITNYPLELHSLRRQLESMPQNSSEALSLRNNIEKFEEEYEKIKERHPQTVAALNSAREHFHYMMREHKDEVMHYLDMAIAISPMAQFENFKQNILRKAKGL